LTQQLSTNAQTLVDFETAVNEGIIDETFPSNCGSWLFKVRAHNNEQCVLELVRLFLQSPCFEPLAIHYTDLP